MNWTQAQKDLLAMTWYHTFKLKDGTQVNGLPEHVGMNNWIARNLRTVDLEFAEVLDVGCASGRFSVQAIEQNARYVTAIDRENNRLMEEVILKMYDNIDFKLINTNALYALDVPPLFDVILCFGLLYHLRCPFWALAELCRKLPSVDATFVIESAMMVSDSDKPLLWCPIEPNPYEPTSCSYFNHAGLVETMKGFNFELTFVSKFKQAGFTTVERQFSVFKRVAKGLVTDQTTVKDLEKYWFSHEEITRTETHS